MLGVGQMHLADGVYDQYSIISPNRRFNIHSTDFLEESIAFIRLACDTISIASAGKDVCGPMSVGYLL